MFQIKASTRFIILWIVMVIVGLVGNGCYASSLFGHYEVAFTVMGHMLMKALPIFLPALFLLNLLMWAMSALPPCRPSSRPGTEWIFYAVFNFAILFFFTAVFLAVAGDTIKAYGQ